MKYISQKTAINLIAQGDYNGTIVLPGKYLDGSPNHRAVWIEDGELVYRHPTDPKRTAHVQPGDKLALD